MSASYLSLDLFLSSTKSSMLLLFIPFNSVSFSFFLFFLQSKRVLMDPGGEELFHLCGAAGLVGGREGRDQAAWA